jgi:hypothetical protein
MVLRFLDARATVARASGLKIRPVEINGSGVSDFGQASAVRRNWMFWRD